jgi:hypothetical protein
MQLPAKLGRIILLGSAVLAPVFAADPFPDQPGALSPAEIQDATAVMKSTLGGEPALPLVASGRRGPEHVMPGYTLFASPVTDFTDRVKARRQIVCNFISPMGKWQCTRPQTELRMTAQGVEHVFTYVVDAGPGDAQAAVDVADYMYSPCFGLQFSALGGEKGTPPINLSAITTVVRDKGGFTVRTGPDEQPDVYRVESTDRKVDGCGFRIVGVRLGKARLVLPEGYEKAAAEQAAKDAAAWREKELALQRERERATPGPAAGPRTSGPVDLADLLGFIFLIAAPIAAAIVAGRYALARAQPGIAWAWGFFGTWGLCVVFGIAAGIIVDVLTGFRFMIPATAAYLMVQFVVGAVAGVIVGWMCARSVRKRESRQG